MSTSNGTALALAAWLRSLGDDELTAVLRARQVRDVGIHDFFDLADALLDPVSVQAALARLDRPSLAALTAATPEPALLGQAAALGLADDRPEADTRVWDAVLTALHGWPAIGLPGLDELQQPRPAVLGPVSSTDPAVVDRAAADRAFTTTTAIGGLLGEYEREPARQLARGGLALPDARRLAAAASVDLDAVSALHDVAERAQLIALEGGSWLPAAALSEWMLRPTAERWSLLAVAWLDRLPSDIRELLGSRSHATWGEQFDDFVSWLYPAGGEWMRERVATYTRDAELLGIIAHHTPSSPGGALLEHGAAAAAEAMAEHFPREIENVYLQHDLTIVSPGPLAPRLDSRLRTMAEVESRALAASYRVSPTSLGRALAAGETADSVREFLGGISLTGIPQPLEYLIAETAARYGLVRVGPLEPSDDPVAGAPRSYIHSTDRDLLGTILVDQSLSMLSLRRAEHGLVSRFEAATVFWSLSDARYPVAAEDVSGATVVLERQRRARAGQAPQPDAASAIVERFRLLSRDAPEETGRAWLERQLDVAIKAKVLITVTITMPDGTAHDYLVQPTSLSSGRLRALDRRADIERTLPLSHITAVHSVD